MCFCVNIFNCNDRKGTRVRKLFFSLILIEFIVVIMLILFMLYEYGLCVWRNCGNVFDEDVFYRDGVRGDVVDERM